MAIRKFIDDVAVHDGDIVYFNDWLKQEKGYTIETYKHSLFIEGVDEDQVDEQCRELEEEFYEWCEDNDLQGETC